MNPTFLPIGVLAKLSQCTIPTIRYYEQIGLIPPASRSAGRRLYDEADVQRLTFIRRCRDFGFPLERVRAMVSLYENRDSDCGQIRDVALGHLEEVEQRMRELIALQKSLYEFVVSCTEANCHGTTGDCVVINDLSRSRKEVRPEA